MANIFYLCCFLVFLNIYLTTGVQTVKGLYCQDPDTRRLYAINTTWPSQSFCGNYTCKLKKRNITETEYTPITKINITNNDLLLDKTENTLNDMSTGASEIFSTVMTIIESDTTPNDQNLSTKTGDNKDKLKYEDENKDRFLTESEIKTITNILHSIRKSDLEAIVDIYNLAQEIYKEADAATTEKNIKKSTTTNVVPVNIKKKINNNNENSESFWYEPLHHHVNKELKSERTLPTSTTSVSNYPATYFTRPLTERDIKKRPYYYPLSDFQRMASYLKPTRTPNNIQSEVKPCDKLAKNYVPTPWYNLIKIPAPEPQKVASQMLLPYPFSYIHHYNFSSYPTNFYYNNNPWAHLNNINNRNKNYMQPYIGPYDTQMPSNVAVLSPIKTEEQHEDFKQVVENKPVESEIKKLPDWQTEPLSAQVIEEVKANVMNKTKLLNLFPRKNIKLERVGKLIKLDDLARKKRHIESTGDDLDVREYETYIEKITCESSTEPGFFRYGNSTAPYPACCPQKIDS